MFIASFFQLAISNLLYGRVGYDLKENLSSLKEKGIGRQLFGLSIAQLLGLPILLILYLLVGSLLSFFAHFISKNMLREMPWQ